MKRPIFLLTAAAVLAAALAGCTGGAPDGADTEESPLTAYTSSFYGGDLSPEEQEARSAADMQAREELIASCMTEEGFEYRPNVGSSSMAMSSDGAEWEPDDREWVSQWGYGAVNYPGRDDQPAIDEGSVDPNQEYISSLSESEQTAFYEALYGPSPTEEEMASEEPMEYNWETSGCQGAADHEISGEDPLQSDEFAGLVEAMNNLYQDTAGWPGMSEIDAEWSGCMDAAGFPGVAVQTDAQNSIYDELNALYESAGASETGPAEDEMDAIAAKEVALATADLDCREETNYRDRYQDVQWAVEEQFIADHKTELEAAKAAAEQARS